MCCLPSEGFASPGKRLKIYKVWKSLILFLKNWLISMIHSMIWTISNSKSEGDRRCWHGWDGAKLIPGSGEWRRGSGVQGSACIYIYIYIYIYMYDICIYIYTIIIVYIYIYGLCIHQYTRFMSIPAPRPPSFQLVTLLGKMMALLGRMKYAAWGLLSPFMNGPACSKHVPRVCISSECSNQHLIPT